MGRRQPLGRRFGRKVIHTLHRPTADAPGLNYTIVRPMDLLYLRVAKTGTRSFSGWFAESDGVRPDYRTGCRLPREWQSRYTSFTVVRNPFDRLVSSWRNKVRHATTPLFDVDMTFAEFVGHVAMLDLDTADPHVRRQTALLPDPARIDHVGRFEDLAATAAFVASVTGLDATTLPHRNRSTGADRDGTSPWTPELRAVVADAYAADFEAFGYET